MRRRPAYPKTGDRVRLEIQLPDGATARARRGTVVERSCGRSNSLRIQWDPEPGRPSTESWLADGEWHWSRGNLRVLPAGAGPESTAPQAAEVAEPWSVGTETARGPRVPAGPGTMVGAALDEWEAALAAEKAPVAEDSWETVLAGALGLPATPPPAPTRPPEAPARVAAPGPAPAPAPAPPPAPVPRPAAEPARVAPAPAAEAPRAWAGDDILPSRAGRKGRRR